MPERREPGGRAPRRPARPAGESMRCAPAVHDGDGSAAVRRARRRPRGRARPPPTTTARCAFTVAATISRASSRGAQRVHPARAGRPARPGREQPGTRRAGPGGRARRNVVRRDALRRGRHDARRGGRWGRGVPGARTAAGGRGRVIEATSSLPATHLADSRTRLYGSYSSAPRTVREAPPGPAAQVVDEPRADHAVADHDDADLAGARPSPRTRVGAEHLGGPPALTVHRAHLELGHPGDRVGGVGGQPVGAAGAAPVERQEHRVGPHRVGQPRRHDPAPRPVSSCTRSPSAMPSRSASSGWSSTYGAGRCARARAPGGSARRTGSARARGR